MTKIILFYLNFFHDNVIFLYELYLLIITSYWSTGIYDRCTSSTPLITEESAEKIMAKHTHINNFHSAVRYTGKNLYRKYIDSVVNIGVNPPLLCYVWDLSFYEWSFSRYPFHHLPWGGEGKARDCLKRLLKIHVAGFIQVKINIKNTNWGSIWLKINMGSFRVQIIIVKL